MKDDQISELRLHRINLTILISITILSLIGLLSFFLDRVTKPLRLSPLRSRGSSNPYKSLDSRFRGNDNYAAIAFVLGFVIDS